ncbi:Cystathionine beta-lyase PatB [bioreactor metagenome]|uniref:cysteine-S-conjugate beta-lyase n=1 Tax=bioreactor metagenome TaxID=1076179 RepID=A0A645BQ08_9ZZZZ
MQEQDGYWTIDFDDLERQLSRENCTMFLHCSPHNPTGRVFTRDELLKIGELCQKYNVFLVSDEIHADLTRVGQAHLPIAMLFPDEQRLLTCTSPSKTFNIAGNNHAHIIVSDTRIRAELSHSAYCGHPGALSIDASMAAYDESEDWLEELRAYLDGNFAMMRALLADKLPNAVFRIPEGTYLAFVDLRAYCDDEQALKERISRAGVFVQFGEDFVDNGSCHMRVNAACPRSVLKEGLNRICAALSSN